MKKTLVGKLILVGFVAMALILPYGSALAQQGEILEKTGCTELMPPFSVSTEISPEMAQALAGSQMRFFVTVKNENSFPIVDGVVYVKIFQKQANTNNAQANGNNLVDQFFAKEGLDLKAKESQKIDFLWTVPAWAPKGEYFAYTYFISSGKKFDLDGLSYTDEISSGRTYFDIKSENKDSVILDRNNVKLNNVKTSPLEEKIFKKDESIIFSAPVTNPTVETQQVTVTYELYKWSNLSTTQRVDMKEETVDLKAKETKTLIYESKDGNYPVYYLVVRTKWKDTFSIINLRFLREGVDSLRLNLLGVGAFPIKDIEGNSVFACVQNAGMKSSITGKLELSIWDGSDKLIKKYDYSGEFENSPTGLKTGFAVPKGFDNFRVKAVLYDDQGKQVDEAEVKYNCKDIDPTLCAKQEAATPATNPPMDTKTLMLYLIISGAVLVIAVVILIIVKKKKSSGQPPMNGPSSLIPIDSGNYGNPGDSTHVEVGQMK